MVVALPTACSLSSGDSGGFELWAPPLSCDEGCAEGWECVGGGCQWRKMLDAVNQVRRQGADCRSEGTFPAAPSLKLAFPLTQAAQRHANTMAETGCFSHDGTGEAPCPDGSACTRIAEAGYLWSAVAENIAINMGGVDDVVEQWLASDGHCKNMLSDRYTELGAGMVRDDEDRTQYVQTFGDPGDATVDDCHTP